MRGGPAGGTTTNDATRGASRSDQEPPTQRRREGTTTFSLTSAERKHADEILSPGVVGLAAAHRPWGAPRCPERTPRGWEAETGPPLTSVGLSVSCNRK